MHSFHISAAKHVNAALVEKRGQRRRGAVFPDRFHSGDHPDATPGAAHVAVCLEQLAQAPGGQLGARIYVERRSTSSNARASSLVTRAAPTYSA